MLAARCDSREETGARSRSADEPLRNICIGRMQHRPPTLQDPTPPLLPEPPSPGHRAATSRSIPSAAGVEHGHPSPARSTVTTASSIDWTTASSHRPRCSAIRDTRWRKSASSSAARKSLLNKRLNQIGQRQGFPRPLQCLLIRKRRQVDHRCAILGLDRSGPRRSHPSSPSA
jgi:hypothetical protein